MHLNHSPLAHRTRELRATDKVEGRFGRQGLLTVRRGQSLWPRYEHCAATLKNREDYRKTVFGNAGAMIAFRTDHTDAELLAKDSFPANSSNSTATKSSSACWRKELLRPFPAKTLPTPIG